jgi:short-subunit dehydrogenase
VTATSLCPGPVRTEFAETAGIGEGAESVPGLFWTDPDFVAEEGVRGMEDGRRVVVPGKLNRAGALVGQHVPRGLLLGFAGRVTPVGR